MSKPLRKKIMEIVHALLEDCVNEQTLIEYCKYLSKNDYEDINTERSLTNLCGYPLCDESIGIVPKQDYHISVKDNKVYQLAERKLFCSDLCYKASIFLKDQLDDESYWIKSEEQRKILKQVVIYKGTKGLKGKEVKLKSSLTENEKPIKKILNVKMTTNKVIAPYIKENQLESLKDSMNKLKIIEKNVPINPSTSKNKIDHKIN